MLVRIGRIAAVLAGYRVLVVEDEALIAQDIKEMLLEAEAVLVGPASGVGEARQLIRDDAIDDLALIDVNLRRRTCHPCPGGAAACTRNPHPDQYGGLHPR